MLRLYSLWYLHTHSTTGTRLEQEDQEISQGLEIPGLI